MRRNWCTLQRCRVAGGSAGERRPRRGCDRFCGQGPECWWGHTLWRQQHHRSISRRAAGRDRCPIRVRQRPVRNSCDGCQGRLWGATAQRRSFSAFGRGTVCAEQHGWGGTRDHCASAARPGGPAGPCYRWAVLVAPRRCRTLHLQPGWHPARRAAGLSGWPPRPSQGARVGSVHRRHPRADRYVRGVHAGHLRPRRRDHASGMRTRAAGPYAPHQSVDRGTGHHWQCDVRAGPFWRAHPGCGPDAGTSPRIRLHLGHHANCPGGQAGRRWVCDLGLLRGTSGRIQHSEPHLRVWALPRARRSVVHGRQPHLRRMVQVRRPVGDVRDVGQGADRYGLCDADPRPLRLHSASRSGLLPARPLWRGRCLWAAAGPRRWHPKEEGCTRRHVHSVQHGRGILRQRVR